MSFQLNTNQQMAIYDALSNLTEREIKHLKGSSAEIFNQLDEEILDSLMFDTRYQCALHTTSFKEQPVSKSSFSNFRIAIYKYNQKYGINLIQKEIDSHTKQFSKLLNIESRLSGWTP